MNPNSDSAWWIVSYTMALIGPSQDPPCEPPLKVLRKAVPVRCVHWREAFYKGRRLIFGFGAMSLGNVYTAPRYSPGGWGLIATILGIIPDLEALRCENEALR